MYLYISNMYKLFVFIFALLILTGCDLLPSPCEEVIITREVSPDKRVDAIISETNCGATVGYIYKVYIVPSGLDSLDDNDHPVFQSGRTEGLKISWVAKQQLYILYDRARIYKYTNFWRTRELDNFNYLVAITETRMSKN